MVEFSKEKAGDLRIAAGGKNMQSPKDDNKRPVCKKAAKGNVDKNGGS